MNGQELKMRRIELGLTMRQLAFLIGVTQDSVYKWENGRLPFNQSRVEMFEKIEARFTARAKIRLETA